MTGPAAGPDVSTVDEPHPRGGRHEPPPQRWYRTPWSVIAIPVGLFLVTRLVQIRVVDWMMPAGSTVRDKLLLWDATWFIEIAEIGYPPDYEYTPTGELTGSTHAFFPGYPALIRATHTVTRLDYATSALLVAWIAGAVAVTLIYLLGTDLYDQRTGLMLAVLFCTQPMSVVLGMAYSEGLFVAFVAGALLAARRGWWLVAGVVGLAGSLTRPTGAALALALLALAVVELVRRTPKRWYALAGALLAATGTPAYLLWVGNRLGEADAYFKLQTAGWGTEFDLGAGTTGFVLDSLRSSEGFVPISVAFILVTAVVLAVVAVWQRVWAPLSVYGFAVLVLVVGQAGYYHSKPRLLVPALLMLVPLAVAAARARTWVAVTALTMFGLAGMWYGAHLVDIWRYAI